MAKQILGTPVFYTDKIETVGSVRRVFWHAVYLIFDDATNTTTAEAHYFGTTVAEAPMPAPYHNAPTFEHAYVQLPADISYMGQDGNPLLYQLGELCGVRRDNLGSK